MAIININEARVSKHIGENGAFQVEEIETVNGQEWTKRYTVWSKEVAPAVDTYVNVSGKLSTKAREYQAQNGDTKVSVDVNINDPLWQIAENAGIPTSLLENEITSSEAPF